MKFLKSSGIFEGSLLFFNMVVGIWTLFTTVFKPQLTIKTIKITLQTFKTYNVQTKYV